jgi:shikimate kinase
MMGAGKTTTGQAVADRLGWAFLDSDRQVEARTGRTVAEIWRDEGERGFRRLETEALAQALAGTDERPAVIAAAGGVVLNPRNRALLQAHPPVVWLRARPETLAARVAASGAMHRPLLDDDPTGALLRLELERRPFYEGLASHVIDVDDLTPAEVVDRVVQVAR